MRPYGLSSQGHPATSRITSRLHLLLSGSRRTALILLAPRWSRPMCSSLPSAFPAHTTSTKRWSSLPSLANLSELQNRSSVLALPDELASSVARHSHSESRDEPRRMPNHPGNEIRASRAALSGRGRPATFTIHTLCAIDLCDSTAVLSTKVSVLRALISSSNVVRLVSLGRLSAPQFLIRDPQPQAEP